MVERDVAKPQGDFFQTGNAQSLSLFKNLNVMARVDKGRVRTRIEPRETAAHDLDMQLPTFKVGAIDVSDLELPAGRRSELCGNVEDLVVVKIKASHGDVRPGLTGFFLNRYCAPPTIEFDHAVLLWGVHNIAKNRGPPLSLDVAPAS